MTDKLAILELIEARAAAIRAKNAVVALEYYADDVVNFDLAPPLAQRGAEAKAIIRLTNPVGQASVSVC